MYPSRFKTLHQWFEHVPSILAWDLGIDVWSCHWGRCCSSHSCWPQRGETHLLWQKGWSSFNKRDIEEVHIFPMQSPMPDYASALPYTAMTFILHFILLPIPPLPTLDLRVREHTSSSNHSKISQGAVLHPLLPPSRVGPQNWNLAFCSLAMTMAWPFSTQFTAQRASKDSIASSFQVSQPDGFIMSCNHRGARGESEQNLLSLSGHLCWPLSQKADRSCILSPSLRLHLRICYHRKFLHRSLVMSHVIVMCMKALHIHSKAKNWRILVAFYAVWLSVEFLGTCR